MSPQPAAATAAAAAATAAAAAGEEFDLVIIDPPPLGRVGPQSFPAALRCIYTLLSLVIKVTARDGLWLLCSCSSNITERHLADVAAR